VFRSQWVFKQPIPKHVLVTAKIVSYLPTATSIDASNLYQGPEDVLQSCGPKCKPGCKLHAGVLTDDCQIENHNDSARYIDRDRPRVEITLRPFVKTTCSWCGDSHQGGPGLCSQPQGGLLAPEHMDVCSQSTKAADWSVGYNGP
jgi:hypothetical protein